MTPTIQTAMDLHRQGRFNEAETHYRSLLAQSPSQFETLHLFGILKLQQGNLQEALTLISKAVEINPSSPDARSNLVAVLVNLGRAADALGHCDSGLALMPSDAGMLYNRGVVLSQLGRHNDALESFDKALATKPDHVNALFSRAGTLAGLHRHEEAIAGFDRLLGIAPRHPEALINRGTVLAQLGRDTEAVASFDRALAITPDHVNALANRGIALKRLQRHDEALASLDRALAKSPDHIGAHVNRGNVLLELNRTEEALGSFLRALALAPADASTLTNKAFCLLLLGRYQDALETCEQAIGADAQYANAFLVRGHTLAKLDRPAEAAASYERVLAIDPGNPYALGASLMAHRTACHWQRVDELVPAIEQAIRTGQAVIPPLNVLGLPLAPDLQLQCAQNFVRHALPADATPFPSRPRASSDKIRLAYLSGDFRRHPVGSLAAALMERHDRARFEVVGISHGVDDGSEERRRVMAACDQFHDVRGRADGDAAALIHELQIDIAVDLGGHTESARPAVLRRRPAPVQVSWLGYPGTMGADFIDHIVGDKVALPSDLAPYFAEKIVHLPDCFLAGDTKQAIAANGPSRAAAGLPERGFVFCCFNSSEKISAAVASVWMRLLAAVEGSVLWISDMNGRAADSLRTAAKAAGVEPARIVVAPQLPAAADRLARQRLADLFVDTAGDNSVSTASDALWAGVPVLTCLGTALPGRLTASLLHAAGLPELVTASLADYEALALKLARDPAQLQSLRGKLEAGRLICPLFDADRFRRHIEAAYATMVDIARRGDEPRSFSVDPIEA